VFESSISSDASMGLSDMAEEVSLSMEACRAMSEILSASPKHFVDEAKVSALFGKYL
jgi:hypothetical protein